MPDPSAGPAVPGDPETNVSDGPPPGATALLGAPPELTFTLPDSGALSGAQGSDSLLPTAVQPELPSDASSLPATTVRDPAVVPGPQLTPPETHTGEPRDRRAPVRGGHGGHAQRGAHDHAKRRPLVDI